MRAAAAFLALALATAGLIAATTTTSALCTTDSECVELCPAGATECDGGPE